MCLISSTSILLKQDYLHIKVKCELCWSLFCEERKTILKLNVARGSKSICKFGVPLLASKD